MDVNRSESVEEVCEALGRRPATSPFRRLTRDEYDRTVRDLLGTTAASVDAFPSTSSGDGRAGLQVSVSPVQFEQYGDAARELATNADLSALHDCDVSALGEESCARRFIRDVGLRAYRRPLDAQMEGRLFEVFTAGRADSGYEDGIQLVLQAMLQSPYFLYKTEVEAPPGSAPDDVVALSDFERASRLSYLIWGTMPDDELLAVAEAGELRTPEQVAAQARRMIDDPRAREPIVAFYLRWLDIDFEGVTLDGTDDDRLPASMQAETARFVEHVLFEGTGTLDELLSASYSFVDDALAGIYGLEDVSADDPVRVELDPTRRAGVLTHPSFLAETASAGSAVPIFRGKFVREQLLCQTLPEPPDVPPFSDTETEEVRTLRQRLAQHREDPQCAGCHKLMDPIGFGFAHYDGLGRYQTETQAGPVDASGEITATEATDGSFYGAVELAERLSKSEDVRRCMANQWLRSGLTRLEGADDLCSLRVMDEAFAGSDYALLELVVALTRTDAFLYRRIGEEEAP